MKKKVFVMSLVMLMVYSTMVVYAFAKEGLKTKEYQTFISYLENNSLEIKKKKYFDANINCTIKESETCTMVLSKEQDIGGFLERYDVYYVPSSVSGLVITENESEKVFYPERIKNQPLPDRSFPLGINNKSIPIENQHINIIEEEINHFVYMSFIEEIQTVKEKVMKEFEDHRMKSKDNLYEILTLRWFFKSNR